MRKGKYFPELNLTAKIYHVFQLVTKHENFPTESIFIASAFYKTCVYNFTSILIFLFKVTLFRIISIKSKKCMENLKVFYLYQHLWEYEMYAFYFFCQKHFLELGYELI